MTMMGKTCPVRARAFSLSWDKRARRAAMSPLRTACFDIFSPLPGAREVMTQVERLSSSETKIALRSVRIGQGDSVLRVGLGASAIHALGDGRWRPGMSGSDGARGADLWEVFSVVPDHRRAEGKRDPLAGLLMIALAAMLAGRSDQLGIVRWGRKLSREA